MRVQTKSLLLFALVALSSIPRQALANKCDCCPCPCTCNCEEASVPNIPPIIFTAGTVTPAITCTEINIDLGLIIDGSVSIDDAEWQQMLDFMIAAANKFTIGPTNTAFAVVQFSANANEEFNFRSSPENNDNANLVSAISAIPKAGRETALVYGLQLYRNQTILTRRPGMEHAVIVVTDGLPNKGGQYAPPPNPDPRLAAEITAFHAAMANIGSADRIYGVAVSDDLLNAPKIQDVMEQVAGDASRVYPVGNYSELLTILNTLIHDICSQIPQPQPTAPPPVDFPPSMSFKKCECCCPPPNPVAFSVGPFQPECDGSYSSSTKTSSMSMGR